MIGYYVHHHGLGHLTRLQAVAEHLRSPVTGLSSLPAPPSWDQDWVHLERDDAMPRAAALAADPTAHGVLHWTPRHDPGLAARWPRSRSGSGAPDPPSSSSTCPSRSPC